MRARGAAIVEYVAATVAVLGRSPPASAWSPSASSTSGGMQLVLHAPFGGAINRAFGLAWQVLLRRIRLRAAGRRDRRRHRALRSAPHTASRSTACSAWCAQPPRRRPDRRPCCRRRCSARAGAGTRVARSRCCGTRAARRSPMNIQRMRADDLLAAVFPAQRACGDNRPGRSRPRITRWSTRRSTTACTRRWTPTACARSCSRIDAGEIRTVAVETTPAPSRNGARLLNAYPYAFLDDAPARGRRARRQSQTHRHEPRTGDRRARSAAIARCASEACPTSATPTSCTTRSRASAGWRSTR